MKIYHWIIACCLLLPLGGCSNWLDVIPEDSVDEKDLFSTGEGYRNALNGVYRQMSQTSMYGQQMSWGFIDVWDSCTILKNCRIIRHMESRERIMLTVMKQ